MRRFLLLVSLGALGVGARAQLSIPPFPTWATENYDSMAIGAYNTFPSMGAWATTTAIPPSGLMTVLSTSGPPLPPLTGTQAMFGRQCDVEWAFSAPMRRFGSYFRTAVGGPGTTAVRLRFYNTSNILFFVSPPLPINTTGYTWYGYWTFQFFRRVEVIGIPGPGYVGHDDTRARPW